MRVGIIVASTDASHALDVAPDMDLLTFKAAVACEVGTEPEEITVEYNGKPLRDNTLTLESYQVKDGDLLQVVIASKRQTAPAISNRVGSAPAATNIDFSSIRVPQQTGAVAQQQSGSGAAKPQEDAESIRKQFLSLPSQRALLDERNPELAAVLNDPAKFREVYDRQIREIREKNEARRQLAESDIIDPFAQQRIFEEIQQRNLDAQLEQALEENPEFYAKVTMLYIDVMIGTHPVKAFVDSGAQMTIMSLNCARRCNLERLIDKRFSGIARGVGEQKIVGRIHRFELLIGGAIFGTSFQVLEQQEIDLLIGLDMLRAHQACIDLKRNMLVLGNDHECPFLPESELPAYARLNQPNDPFATPLSPSAPSPSQPSASSTSGASTARDTQFPEDKINKLSKYGFSRTEIIQELTATNGDVEKALAALLAKSLMLPSTSMPTQKRT